MMVQQYLRFQTIKQQQKILTKLSKAFLVQVVFYSHLFIFLILTIDNC